ncbi:TetR/AcrR family transcriptional regulator [Streptomyces sp. NPDC059474]|uniref:TetR/AcrR family transcriptional regulator n=1 Tax=Streptomyces sp. NPDC059474 TaxID=3346846 RepID=UPI0036AD99FC
MSQRTGRPMRTDAVCDRARLLEAVARLVTEACVEHVNMNAVARAASVGKGTVFRYFGDRSRLLMALLDHTEQAYQASSLTGLPPQRRFSAPPLNARRARVAAFEGAPSG